MRTEYEMKDSIRYPSEEQMSLQIESILDKSHIRRRSASEVIKAAFIGPGFSVIFYRFKLILFGSFLIYLFLAYICHPV